MFRNEIGLNGRFKFDVYDKNDNLKYTTDYVDNFITPSGLNYPHTYAFADCFRYLSLGTGTGANAITGQGTTGLHRPLTGYAYNGGGGHTSCGTTAGQTNKYVAAGCGYRIDGSGVTLFRAWRFPETTTDYFTGSITFKEYMLSPGRPAVTVYNFNPSNGLYDIISGVCGCDKGGFGDSAATTSVVGKEALDFANFYPSICTADKAFSRVLKDVSVGLDEYLIVNYALTVKMDSGVKTFSLNVSRNNPFGDNTNWIKISGIHNAIHPGIKLVSNGVVTSVTSVTDMTSHQFRAGESFVPPLGNPFEAACLDSLKTAYISNDNLQFIVNNMTGHGIETGSYFPYNSVGRAFPSGLMAYRKDWIDELSSSVTSLGGKISNAWYLLKPRSEYNASAYSAFTPYASQADFRTSVAHNSAFLLTGAFSPTTTSPITNGVSTAKDGTLPITGRSRAIITSYQFKDPNLANNFPVRAAVVAYKYNSTNSIYPFLDVIFAPSGGPRIANIDTGAFTYTDTLNSLGPIGTTGYSYMDASNILQLQYRLGWSSPCSTGVIGC